VENIVDLWILGITVSNCVLFVPYLAAWFSRRVTTSRSSSRWGFSFLRFLAFLFMGSGDLIRFMWIGVLTDTAIVFLVTLLSQRSGKPARAVSLFRSSSPARNHQNNVRCTRCAHREDSRLSVSEKVFTSEKPMIQYKQ
jgi:hypothetical protein